LVRNPDVITLWLLVEPLSAFARINMSADCRLSTACFRTGEPQLRWLSAENSMGNRWCDMSTKRLVFTRINGIDNGVDDKLITRRPPHDRWLQTWEGEDAQIFNDFGGRR
jgi:hypothetical protein